MKLMETKADCRIKKGVDGVDSGATYRNDTESNSLDWSTRRLETLSRILGIDHSIFICISDDWCDGLLEKCWRYKELKRIHFSDRLAIIFVCRKKSIVI